jgi:hypothetical protein
MKNLQGVSFSVVSDAAWAPAMETREAWAAWANDGLTFPAAGTEPAVRAMPAMLRRRTGFLAKMTLEVAYQCLGGRTDVPTLFCSRHGEVSRSVDLLSDLARGEPISPTSFGLSVHNAAGGMFSIARGDKANNIALSAGQSTIEHGVIEACGLLADGDPEVLLVAYDCPLPALYAGYQDSNEQPYAWAWLMQLPKENAISLSWTSIAEPCNATGERLPSGLEVLRFHLRQERQMQRACGKKLWNWARHG